MPKQPISKKKPKKTAVWKRSVVKKTVTKRSFDDAPLTKSELKALRPIRVADPALHAFGLQQEALRGRPKKENPKQVISVRVDAELARCIKGYGKGYNQKAEALLAAGFMK